MYKKRVPCLQFPTTIVLLDDETNFLDGMCFQLGHKMSLTPFQSAKAATRFLLEEYQSGVLSKNWQCDDICNPYGEEPRQLDIDPFKIRNEMYRADRFQEIAVVVADYAMPEMSGLDFFKTIVHLPFKRILLTGEADEKIAVEAFNQGLIHRYIRKDNLHCLKHLRAAILEMEAQYFEDISEGVVARLENNANCFHYGLNDPSFIAFFNQFAMSHYFAEFYLTGPSASFVFLDPDGVPGWLAVKDETEIKFCEETADEASSAFVLNGLAQRQYVPYFYHCRDKFPEKWDTFLHPAKIIKGVDTSYYVAYIDRPTAYPVACQDKIVSYKAFLTSKG